MIYLTIPWPPSANRYYRSVKGRAILSKEAREYRASVVALVKQAVPFTNRLKVVMHAFPPDNRKRDLDNLLKQTSDALQHAGVYVDDSQIDHLTIQRCVVVKGGKMLVEVWDGYTGHD
jgi:crossover junction endodeoxyribonuclease RusA